MLASCFLKKDTLAMALKVAGALFISVVQPLPTRCWPPDTAASDP